MRGSLINCRWTRLMSSWKPWIEAQSKTENTLSVERRLSSVKKIWIKGEFKEIAPYSVPESALCLGRR